MKPYSENIVFIDTEFSTLDPYKGEIMSIAIVKLNGEELYLELEYEGELSDWMKENLGKMFDGKKVNREIAKEKIKEFIGQSNPYAVAFVPQFDFVYLHKLFGDPEQVPFHWMSIDFASMMFAHGYDPETYSKEGRKFIHDLGIDPDKYKNHHALDDAKLLREVYLKFFKKK